MEEFELKALRRRLNEARVNRDAALEQLFNALCSIKAVEHTIKAAGYEVDEDE